MSDKVPDLLLERLHRGELSEEEARAVALRLDGDADGRLQALRRSDEEILAALPPEQVTREVTRRLGAAERPARRPLWLLAVPAGAAALLLVLSLPPRPGPAPREGAEQTRIKGPGPRLLLFRKPQSGQQPRQLRDGEPARAGDVLQLGYAGGRSHCVLLSLDGRGAVTLHFPAAPDQPSLLGGGQVLLPSAYELDDAPGFERFVLVTGDGPIDVEEVLARARALARSPQAGEAPLALPAGLSQRSLTLSKEGGR